MSDLHVVRTVVVASFRGPKTRAALFFLFLFWSLEDTGAVTNAMIYLLDAPMPGNRARERADKQRRSRRAFCRLDYKGADMGINTG